MNKKHNTSIQMIADYEGDISHLFDVEIPENIPILATRNLVLFPGVVSPILVGRIASVNLINKLKKNPDQIFAIFCQKNADVESPEQEDLFEYGVYAKLVRVLEMSGPGNNITAIVQALGKCKLSEINKKKPFLVGQTIPQAESLVDIDSNEYESAIDDLRKLTVEYIKQNEDIPDETQFAITNIQNNVIATNFICSNMPFAVEDKFTMLQAESSLERVYTTLKVLHKELQLQQIKQNIRSKTREDLDEQQREYFLQQQIKNIREELGSADGSPERKELEKKAESKKWNEDVEKIFYKELDKLDILNPQSPDYSVQLNYLQTMVSLPWNEYTEDDLNIQRAQKILDKDHYGMEKVKERILEHLAVLQLSGNLKSPIICLYGAPGVGKTSLGKSVAKAMNRKYVRMSLGGLHDESEIRGHRRTYIGAMPGRIIKSMQKAGSSNPVFILDEIDKVTQNTHNGDPSSALLEVLDPEQNNAFHDNYLDVDFDLSKVLFIATANDLNTIPRPLLDRMELIEVSGYITEEKQEIAKRHLIPRELTNTGLINAEVKPTITKAAVEKIIEQYTRESGVRQLEKQINKAMRKLAYLKAMNGDLPFSKITPAEVVTLLGKPPYYRDIYQGNAYAGVVTGLAWTSVGGEILFIETSLSKGNGSKLTLTGNLGDVMKESAVIALEYIKAHINSLGVDYRIFDQWNIHIHVPEGATPKDGPSAGITIATSIASALTQRKVRKNTAMTGEITLRGKVLPVGGIKEKILAAKRAGITDIMLCKDNKKDIDEIPAKYLTGLEFHFVEDVQDVLNFALTDELVDHAISFDIEEKKKN
ncbi:MAG: endopeptidase La [Prevotella sp.]|nr:endopeptidase La [Prevotella sp.]MDD7462563.1 endopeptidase La [Prevotellaceae bacterium]MDY3365831.1 endopeptidase La [Prevotella sp.]